MLSVIFYIRMSSIVNTYVICTRRTHNAYMIASFKHFSTILKITACLSFESEDQSEQFSVWITNYTSVGKLPQLRNATKATMGVIIDSRDDNLQIQARVLAMNIHLQSNHFSINHSISNNH